MITSAYAVIVADVRIVVPRIQVEGFSRWLISVHFLAPYRPDILNLYQIHIPDIFRPHDTRATKFGGSIAYDEARMDMRDDNGEILIGVGIEGKIDWRLIFVGWK